MSLQLAAQHLASRGRGPDTQLVHMAPQEVAGLQALAKAAGGTLTTNPDTGLPEAGFLKNLLPTLIGAGLSMIPGVGPLMAAGIVGGGTALSTGSLEKGLMAGLGAYGGAGLGAGLMNAGAQSAVTQSAAEAARLGLPAVETTAAMTPSAQMAAGFKSAVADPSKFVSTLGGGMGAAKYGLAAMSPMMQGPEPTQYQGSKGTYESIYDPDTGRYVRVPLGTRDQMASTPPMFPSPIQPPMQTTTPIPTMADGGPVQSMSDRNQMLTLMSNGGQMFAAGGISHLGDYSDGGRLLKGPGDGVSDSIPATIADKRPARLADGEFVVPARIVSELGNGSTDAGARKLYAMMDRIQKARGKTVGKDRVAVNSRADKALPA